MSHRTSRKNISSYGVIVFKRIKSEINYLLVQRKDTYSHVEFLRGKYKLNNMKYINILLENMSEKEIKSFHTKSFNELWNQLWMKKTEKKFNKEYEISKTKFEKLKKEVILHNKTYSLNKLINKIPKFKKDTSWGFPKGRKMKNEINLHCAMREFEEETNYKRYDYKILNDIILKETIVGVNGITYQHYYYLAEDLSNNKPYLDEKNLNQITEIKDIKFFSYNKCYKLFNNTAIPKLTVLIKAQNLIQN